MAEETKVTPGAEAIAPAVTPPEGSIAAIAAPVPTAPVADKKEETVPLSVFLAQKEDMKDLKKQLSERPPQSQAEQSATIKAFAEKYPDTDPEAIAAIVNMAVTQVEAKYNPIIEGQKARDQQAEFDRQFDIIFDKALAENPDARDVDKEVIKALALTAAYNNTPLTDLIKKVYPGGNTGRATTENNMRVTGATIDTIVDIDKITPEQRSQIMNDPVLTKAYFDKLDALGR